MNAEEFNRAIIERRLYIMPPTATVPDVWYVCTDDRKFQGFGHNPIAAVKDLLAAGERHYEGDKPAPATNDDLSFLE